MNLDLVLVIDEKPLVITEDSTNADKSLFEAWERSTKLSLDLMRLTMSENVKPLMPKTDDAKEFMKLIKEFWQFDITNKSITGNLTVELTNRKFDWSQPIHDHVTGISYLITKLKAMGMEQCILNSLPAELHKMALVCGSTSVTPFLSHKNVATNSTKSSFVGFQLPLQKVNLSSPVRTLLPTTSRVLCEQEDTATTVAKVHPRFTCVLKPRFKGLDIRNKSWYPKAADHVNREKTWYVVDATDKVLGRLASTIAIHIRGKNLESSSPSVNKGAIVIVVNAEKVAVSRRYKMHYGRPGGMTVETFAERIPERIIEQAVRAKLPTARLGRRIFTHLKVYKGPDHPYAAKKPIDLPI